MDQSKKNEIADHQKCGPTVQADGDAFSMTGSKQQTEFDLAALERATGRTLNPDERRQFMDVQLQANRWTYIGSGMSHPKFVEMMALLNPDRQREVQDAVPMFS
jgi:hypothetical protein